ncbi:MAG: hypothetical protein R6U36_03245 [Candidatus Fermentibacteraceae bacterium]
MKSKILVRTLIVVLAALLIWRIHSRAESYRIPRDECRTQLLWLSKANVRHMYENDGMPAPSLDSLSSYAEEVGYLDASLAGDSVVLRVTEMEGIFRRESIPEEWPSLWDDRALNTIRQDKEMVEADLEDTQSLISETTGRYGLSADSLLTVREAFVRAAPQTPEDRFEFLEDRFDPDSFPELFAALEEDPLPPEEMEEVNLSAAEIFDLSIGRNIDSMITAREDLAAEVDEFQRAITAFNDSIVPARQDSVARSAFTVCPIVWEAGYHDSLYHYDPKLALGTQFAISCSNHNRHGGVVGGLVEKDYPDSLFYEADWLTTYVPVPFEEYEQNRRLESSRANLSRVVEEQAVYLASRYPDVLKPRPVDRLDINLDELDDPMGGDYLFEITEDTVYTFYENPEGRTARARGDEVRVQTWRFAGWATSNPDTSRVELFFMEPLRLPSIADGARAGDNDSLVVIRYWDRSDLGTLGESTRNLDLLEQPRWEFLQSYAERHPEVQEAAETE